MGGIKTKTISRNCPFNVPVLHMARYVMVLRWTRSITRGIGRGTLEIETSLGPEMATCEAGAIWAQKSLSQKNARTK